MMPTANGEGQFSARGTPGPNSYSMFGDNTFVQGGEFVVNNQREPAAERVGFTLLREQVASTAFHNSAQRSDPPRCHPNTRVKILQGMFDWVQQPRNRDKWILWLNGAAGAGKSAIMQTLAERCIKELIAIAAFFFFRGDVTRNSITPLFATLAYQLIMTIPETADDILNTIECNPLIFGQSLKDQMSQLLIQPLLHLPNHSRRLFVIFLDGLDECNDRRQQSALIDLLGSVTRTQDVPIIFLVASRREPEIEAAFVTNPIAGMLKKVALDNSDIEQSSGDIRRFLIDKFTTIKTTHLRKHLLPVDWPPISTIDQIVKEASGQFIFASVIVNYVSSPNANPKHQLDVIHDLSLRHPTSQNPFAHLDSLYRHIFSQVERIDEVYNILAFQIITGHSFVKNIETKFKLVPPSETEILLANLASVIQLKPCDGSADIIFLHASLPDFLQDSTRSEKWFLDLDKYTTKLLFMFLSRIYPPTYSWNLVAKDEFWRLNAIWRLLKKEKISEELQNSFMGFQSTFHTTHIDDNYGNAKRRVEILACLKDMNFGDEVYQHVLHMFAYGHSKFWHIHHGWVKSAMRKSHDLCARIRELRPDLASDPSLDPNSNWKSARR